MVGIELHEAKFYKDQITILLEKVGFPLREHTILKKIILETKAALPHFTPIEPEICVETENPGHAFIHQGIKHEVQVFWSSLTEEERSIQKLRYQNDKVMPFEGIGKHLRPKRSGEHCRLIDRYVRECMKDLFLKKAYHPPGKKIELFIQFFLEEMQNNNL